MSYLIYNKHTFYIFTYRRNETYKTEAAAKAALTRLAKKGELGQMVIKETKVTYPSGFEGTEREHRYLTKEDFLIAGVADFRQNIEPQVERINIMSGKPYLEALNTPCYLSPSCETYWSM